MKLRTPVTSHEVANVLAATGHSYNRYVKMAMPIVCGATIMTCTPRSYSWVNCSQSSTARYNFNIIKGIDVPFTKRITLNLKPKRAFSLIDNESLSGAPICLEQRMEILRRLPPPTSQEVRAQLKDSAETRKKLRDSQIA